MFLRMPREIGILWPICGIELGFMFSVLPWVMFFYFSCENACFSVKIDSSVLGMPQMLSNKIVA